MDYIPWLRQQLQNDGNRTLKQLADGSSFKAISYIAYTVNGYVFYTVDAEKNKTTQNNGVSMKAITSFKASARDTNLVYEEVTYYGKVTQILELDYHDFKVVVFYCDWVRIEDANGCTVDPETNLIFVNLSRLKSNSKEDDELFILSSEATQVFYCKDQSRLTEYWHVVLDVPKRLNRGIDSYEDPLVIEDRINDIAVTSTLEDEVYVT